MTLIITELRDDNPVGPDPTFNPNIFSEDEEDIFQGNEPNNSPSHTNNNVRRKLTLNERVNNTTNSNINQEIANNTPNNNATLAQAESYAEFPWVDTNNETVNNVPETVYSAPVRHAPQAVERRVNTSNTVPNRHAISPLRCEGSVPTLQSPKNAVAPTDIIFERPSPQTVTCGGRGDFCGGRADYSVRSDGLSLKSNMEQQSFSLNLSLEPSRQVTIKKCDNHVTDNCLSKLRKNICSRGESGSFEMNTRILKSFCNKNYENEVHPDAMFKRTDTLKNLQRSEDLKYIDEETPVETNMNSLTERTREVRVQRTTTVVPISPVCANIPVYDAMTRSCSVGYLDLVDPQAQVSLTALRGEPPRRLILVNNKRHRRQARKHFKTNEAAKQGVDIVKTPSLKKCGKSKSLDSSELTKATDKSGKKQTKTELLHAPSKLDASLNCSSRSSTEETSGASVRKGKETPRRSRRDYPVCTSCRLVSPYDKRDVDEAVYVCVACSPRPLPAPLPAPARAPASDSDTDYSKYYS